MSEEQKDLNEHIKELVYQLRNNPDEAVRFEAIQELQAMQENAERALNDLIETLHNETDYDVLYLVIETIGNFGPKAEKAVPDLIDLIETFYDDEEILQLILDTFGKIGKGAKKAEQAIKNLINDCEERTIRYYAIQALERVIGSESIPFLYRIALNEDEDELIRIEAIKTMAKIGTKEIISKLKKLHGKIASDEIKINIEAVLGELGESKIIPKLMARLMEGSQSYERAIAAEALGKIRAKEAIPILLETAMEDRDILVREKAVKALGNIRSKEATDILIQILQEETNKDLRMEVIDAFGRIGGEEVIQALETVIENDADDDIRIKAINALIEINALNSGTILTAILYEDSSFNVRKAAGKALGIIGGQEDIAPLVDMLQNLEEDEAILEIVKETLLKLGKKGYASALVGLIKNTDDIDIKDEATRMIVEIEPMKAIPELLPLLEDKDSLLRSLTAFMLSEIGKKLGFEDYEQLIIAYESGAVERNLAQKQVLYELELKKQDILEKLKADEAEVALQKERELNLRKIIKRYSEIALERMANLLKFKDTLELEKWLLELPDELAFQVQKDTVKIPQLLQKETIEAEEAISKIIDSFKEVGNYTCNKCGYPIEKDFKLCPDCGEPIPHCEICKLPISFGDIYGFCPLCEAKGHLSHFQEWVKANGTCPHCLQKIPLEGIVPVERTIKKR